jgi:ATP-binding cassette subfamily C (CFTR/MRP) protein 1
MSDRDKMVLGGYFGYLIFSTLMAGMVMNYMEFTLNRIGYRIANAVTLMMFDKIGKINVLNKTKHSTGNILNYVQTDALKFQGNLARSISFISTVLSLIFGMIVLYLTIENIMFIVLAIFLVCTLCMSSLYTFRLDIVDNLMTAKDSRVGVLTTAINNIKFIKTKGWENFFQLKIFTARKKEIKGLTNLMWFSVLEIFVMWMSISTCQIGFVIGLTVFQPQTITLAKVSAVLSVIWTLFDTLILLPWYASLLLDFRVSFKRIRSFLLSEELQPDIIKYDQKALGENAIVLKSGEFYWQTPVEDSEEKAEAERKLKEAKKLAGRNSHAIREDNSLGEPLNNTILDQRDPNVAFKIDNIDFHAPKGSLVFVIGKIGSGKSSLLYALVGEMKATVGAKPYLNSLPKVAFLSQTPWLVASTIKENIVLDSPFDEAAFSRALRLSQLQDDIVNMPHGVETFIGENGSTVSGGQRTRIAIARLIYQDPDIIIMDDPLSALDLKVADKIMKEAICGELKDKTRIISTHAIHNLKYADYIYVMENGKFIFEGTYQEITGSETYNEFKAVTSSFNLEEEATKARRKSSAKDMKIDLERDMAKGTTREEEKEAEFFKERDTTEVTVEEVEAPAVDEEKEKLVNKLFLEEDRVQGKVGLTTVLTMIREMGGFMPIILILMSVFSLQVTNFISDYYHLEWARNFDIEDKYEYIYLLIFLLIIRCVMTSVRALFVFGTQVAMANNIHAKMTFRILHAKITEFLERVPAGRILNRFTKDIEVIDRDISWSLNNFYFSFGSVVLNVIVIIWTVGWVMVLPLVVFMIAGAYYQRKLMETKREIVRLEATARSPVAACVTTLLRGAPEIRVLHRLPLVKDEFMVKVETTFQNSILLAALDAWYMNHVNILNVMLIQIPGFLILSYYLFFAEGQYPIEKIVMFVLRSIDISGSLIGLLLSISQLETQMISIERCSNFGKIDPEVRYLNFDQHEKKYLYPDNPSLIKNIMLEMEANDKALIPMGDVQFIDVTARYPTKPTPVLSNLNIHVRPGEKIGIVGRTGAGKTSLIKLFWMCLEPSEGLVIIDGKNAMKVDVKVLRSNMDIISQETAIFEGTLRENLDPKLEYLYDKNSDDFKRRDKELLQRLLDIGFKEETLEGKGLDYMITGGGENLSLGQKQIICFMRVLLSPKKLMIFDEATANIDLKTEKLMSDAVKNEFRLSTMFIIAHRIQTVLECDKICIMDMGKIVEFDTPQNLIKNPKSIFTEIYRKLQENTKD